MAWIKKDDYYLENNGWTLCKTGIAYVRYGLWKGSVNHGWFDTSKQAMDKWKELTA